MATTTTPLTLPQQSAPSAPSAPATATIIRRTLSRARWLLLRLSLAWRVFSAWFWPERAAWWDTWRCAHERDRSLLSAERVGEATVRAWVLRTWRRIARDATAGRGWHCDADLWRWQVRELLADLGAVVEAHEDASGAQHYTTRLGDLHVLCGADTEPTLEAVSLLAELDAPLARAPRSADPTTQPTLASTPDD